MNLIYFPTSVNIHVCVCVKIQLIMRFSSIDEQVFLHQNKWFIRLITPTHHSINIYKFTSYASFYMKMTHKMHRYWNIYHLYTKAKRLLLQVKISRNKFWYLIWYYERKSNNFTGVLTKKINNIKLTNDFPVVMSFSLPQTTVSPLFTLLRLTQLIPCYMHKI